MALPRYIRDTAAFTGHSPAARCRTVLKLAQVFQIWFSQQSSLRPLGGILLGKQCQMPVSVESTHCSMPHSIANNYRCENLNSGYLTSEVSGHATLLGFVQVWLCWHSWFPQSSEVGNPVNADGENSPCKMQWLWAYSPCNLLTSDSASVIKLVGVPVSPLKYQSKINRSLVQDPAGSCSTCISMDMECQAAATHSCISKQC